MNAPVINRLEERLLGILEKIFHKLELRAFAAVVDTRTGWDLQLGTLAIFLGPSDIFPPGR